MIGIFAANNTPIDAAVRNRVVAAGGYTLPSAAPGWPAHLAGTWRVESDFMDLDGDGITEAVEKGSGGMVVRSYSPAGRPPRLLYQISNGRGATTTALYSSMSGAAVEQHPELGKPTPNTM